MRTIDFTPLNRFAVGFDRMQRQLESMAHLDDAASAYPPYNIEVLGEDAYRITMAVAGFGVEDLDLTVQDTQLTVSGRIDKPAEDVKYLHRGIANRTFERRFELADHIKVSGAEMHNGLLHIELTREVPEALKPRKIAIAGADARGKTIEHKAA
ncbi:MAG: Hsp20 family protein [Alphaproteobacteria bacterium]|nr:Hsp20 family protein [Alphaproteobacteria bacterium]MBF0249304.1 Hsp20 family protein [Alphaproteobacteria bacterium]